MSAFDKIKLGLEEAIAYEKGMLPAKTTQLTIVPVETYQADEIKRIRNSTGLTQRSFAAVSYTHLTLPTNREV